jgi:sigma-B regulation protein RsbU (phosphoserine phosphatase)
MPDVTSERLREAEARAEFDEHLELLVSAAEDFAGSLKIEETLQHVVRRMKSYLDAEASSLFLLEDGGELVCRACAGPMDITGVRLPMSQGVVGRTVRDAACYMVRDVRSDPDFAGGVDQTTGFLTRSILSAPLRAGSACIGALEVLNKQGGDGLFDERDRHVLGALASLAALAIRNARMAQSLVEQERIRRELEVAGEIQRSLLPGPKTAALPVAGVNLPAYEVSGDFYDYFPRPDGRIVFSIGDVAGKGVDAALLMAKTISLLRCLGKTLASPSELLSRVNEELYETATRGKFVSAVAGWLDPQKGEVTFANAGHPAPLLRTAGGVYRSVGDAGPPLGVLSGLQIPETRVFLQDGLLYLFTDGITEAVDAAGRVFGIEGLQQALSQAAELPPSERIESVARQVLERSSRRRDDITLLLVGSPHAASAAADGRDRPRG